MKYLTMKISQLCASSEVPSWKKIKCALYTCYLVRTSYFFHDGTLGFPYKAYHKIFDKFQSRFFHQLTVNVRLVKFVEHFSLYTHTCIIHFSCLISCVAYVYRRKDEVWRNFKLGPSCA